MAPLIPKLRGHFAEFLSQSSLERLRMLSSPTCVSFSTDTQCTRHRGFSWKPRRPLRQHKWSRHHPWVYASGFAYSPPSGLTRHFYSPVGFCDSVPPVTQAYREWYTNINALSIDYAFRPRLRVRLTLGGIAFPRKP